MWGIIEPILSWSCIIGMGAVMGWVFYAGMIKPVTNPTPTTTQTGGISYNYDIKVGALSCAKIPPPENPVVTAIKPVVKAVVKK